MKKLVKSGQNVWNGFSVVSGGTGKREGQKICKIGDGFMDDPIAVTFERLIGGSFSLPLLFIFNYTDYRLPKYIVVY